MTCSSCQHENPEGAKFCNACGAKLETACPQCGHVNPPGSRFCNECGFNLAQPPSTAPERRLASPQSYTPKHLAEKILTSRGAVEGERKQVTVLFADIAGFTAMAEKLDPEEVHQIIDRCFELITAEVHRFEGTINQSYGLEKLRGRQSQIREKLTSFEERYGLKTDEFYQRFREGKIGDEMDFFEWSALADIYQEISQRLAEAERLSEAPSLDHPRRAVLV